MARSMADGVEGQGLVFALCPDTAVFARLTSKMPVEALTSDAVRIAACGSSFSPENVKAFIEPDAGLKVYMLPGNDLEGSIADELDDEPLLRACFACLAASPGGGVPWEGSWRANALDVVCRGLRDGGMILVVASDSLDEQRTWARALLQCGCAFVHLHHASNAPSATQLTR